jgi:hypothetical protein
MTRTDFWATSLELSHLTTLSGNISFSSFIGASATSNMCTEDPAGSFLARFFDMGEPMRPKPTKPIDTGVLLIVVVGIDT